MELIEKIFSIDSEEAFIKTAFEVYDFQVKQNPVYRQFVEALNLQYPKTIEEIPFLPISFFKTHKVLCQNTFKSDLIFKSSGTTGEDRSKHYITDPKVYEKSFELTYRKFLGNPEEQVILALLPNYLEQGNSSLVYMVDHLVNLTNSILSGFLLNELSQIEKRYTNALLSGKKVVVFGVSYALLDLAEKNINLSKATIIETGGMKGRRKELTKEELHQELMNGLNVPYVSSEYGMTELLSQAYSDSEGLFECPAWMKILCRDVNDPFSYEAEGKTGGVNVIDLANIYSCSFIATQDLGKIEGNKFRIMGRFDNADIRGCNLMLD